MDTEVYTQVTNEQAANNLDILIEGAYGLLGSGNSVQNGVFLNNNGALYGTDLLLIGDLLASENYVTWRGTFQQYNEISRKQMVSTNSVIARVWAKAYKTINIANFIIESAGSRGEYRAQGLLIRAIVHFELLKLWGQNSPTGLGIPLALASTKGFSEIAKSGRATVDACYNRIIADLQQAISLDNGNFQFGKTAMNAYLVKVLMQKGDFQAALDIIAANSDLTGPIGDFATTFNSADFARNVIFGIPQTEVNNAGTTNDGLTTFYGCDPDIPGSSGRGDVDIDTLFYSQYDSSDVRFSQYIYIGLCQKASITSGKWKNPFANIPILRTEDFILCRAECNVRLGTSVGNTPLVDINFIRSARGAPLLPVGTVVTLDIVRQERELEFAFEGHRIHDMKRFGVAPYLNNEFLLPIPQQEINTNSAIAGQQNPGY